MARNNLTLYVHSRQRTPGHIHLGSVFLVLLFMTAISCVQANTMGHSSFTLFESGQVRPLAQSPDGKMLFAVNTPDNRLEVYRITEHGLKHRASIPVGLEPVAVAVRNNGEVWVVNHLSDSVSIIDVRKHALRVVRTLLVGDEPRDIVFAGKARDRAFITTAHRGQNTPFDPQLTVPGIGRADVWVFNAEQSDDNLGGTPLNILTFFTDTPRALAVSPDGTRVFTAGFASGNRTTVIFEDVVTANGGLPGPVTNFEGLDQPHTGLIVKYSGEHWLDETGRSWDDQVKFSLPDKDVFIIDASANPPVPLKEPDASYSGVGTVLFNMIVNPKNGHVYVTNTEAQNENRFEGPGIFARQTLRGHLHESRITILRENGDVVARHINKHIDYSSCCAPIPNDENQRSLALPMGMAINGSGETLYVAAFGSSKIGVFDTGELEDNSFTPDTANQIPVSGGGPSGLLLDEGRGRLYVLTRFNNAISIIDTHKRTELKSIAMYNPEPANIIQGRRFLYDASYTSSHGDTACASCHTFADFDSLAWDLGDPDNSEINNPGPFTLLPEAVNSPQSVHFRPMKGPMTTQSLRGLANHGPMHWRGDRTGGNDTGKSAQPDTGTFDEEAAFKKFNIAFEGLNGRHAQLTDAEMQALTDFILQITYPPNPIRNLDNSLTADQQAGHNFYFGSISDIFFSCNGCHTLDPKGNAEFGVAKPGFFGTDGQSSFENEAQVFKIPHLRNMYQKVGMFGMPRTTFILPESTDPDVDNAYMGDQVRGFGFMHDGAADTLFRFFGSTVFAQRPAGFIGPNDPGNPGGFPIGPEGMKLRRQVEAFVLAFDSNLAPVVGQQVTLTAENAKQVTSRINLLIARAEAGECDLVVRKGYLDGYFYIGNGMFKRNLANKLPIMASTLIKQAQQHGEGETTYTCTPPGSGIRIGIDRDEDGHLDGDERRLGSDPADPNSVPLVYSDDNVKNYRSAVSNND